MKGLRSRQCFVRNFLRYDQDFYGGRVALKRQGLIGLAYPALKNGSVEYQLMCLIGRAYENRAKMAVTGPHHFPGLLQYVE